MKRSKLLLFSVLGLACSALLSSVSPSYLSAQQIDPFYLNLLEKAQRSFLEQRYEDAARDFEVAAFGLLDDKVLRAKAYVYLSLCKYYLKDITASEKRLREAADLMGQEGFAKLEIYESAWPDLEKLIAFFNIFQTGTAPPAKEVEKPKPANPEPPGPRPDGLLTKPGAKTGTSSEQPTTQGGETRDAQGIPDPQKPAINLDDIKEGDLLPLDLIEKLPVAARRVPAIYPSYAGASLIEGTVMVNALISENGDVIQTEITKGLKGAFGFDQAAERAVRQWKFEPASVKGIKVKVWLPIAIEFKKQSAQ